VQLFFVRCDEFFDRPEIYGEHGTPYEDNATRFIFFNKAAIELARRLTPAPQILPPARLGRRLPSRFTFMRTICHSLLS